MLVTQRASSEGLAMWRPTKHKLVQVRLTNTCTPAIAVAGVLGQSGVVHRHLVTVTTDHNY